MFSSMIDRLKFSFSQTDAKDIYCIGLAIMCLKKVYCDSKKCLLDYREGKKCDSVIKSELGACFYGALLGETSLLDIFEIFLWPVYYGMYIFSPIVLYLNPPNIKK